MTKTQVIALHGGETFDSYDKYLENLRKQEIDFVRLGKKDWKAALGEKLGEQFHVITPEMPNKKNAKYLEWKIWFDKIAPFLQDGCILIGHSLGGIFLVKYLAEERIAGKIKGLFLIAAPYDSADFEDSLADFVVPGNLENTAKQVEQIFIYHSKDDPVVPLVDADKYKKALPKAEINILDGRQHFNQPEFPELVEKIKGLAKKALE